MSSVFGLQPTFRFRGLFPDLNLDPQGLGPLAEPAPRRVGSFEKSGNNAGLGAAAGSLFGFAGAGGAAGSQQRSRSSQDVFDIGLFDNPFNAFNQPGSLLQSSRGGPGFLPPGATNNLGRFDQRSAFQPRQGPPGVFNASQLRSNVGNISNAGLAELAQDLPGVQGQFQSAANALASAAQTQGFGDRTKGAFFSPGSSGAGGEADLLQLAFSDLIQRLGQQRLL